MSIIDFKNVITDFKSCIDGDEITIMHTNTPHIDRQTKLIIIIGGYINK